jgi:hypothetical protein
MRPFDDCNFAGWHHHVIVGSATILPAGIARRRPVPTPAGKAPRLDGPGLSAVTLDIRLSAAETSLI